MSATIAILLLSASIPATIQGAAFSLAGPAQTAVTHPSFVEAPKSPDSLTLYNAKGEVVAKCGKKGDQFSDCKLEPGVTLDDVMNAWVHAYQDLQK